MDDKQYRKTQETLIRLAREVSCLDLEAFISRIRTSEAVGPVLDPTLYSKAYESLGRIKLLAESLNEVKKVFTRQVAEELEAISSKPGKTNPLDLSKPVVDPRICPECKEMGAKQARDHERGVWSYACHMDHTWEGIG